jgi:hypothetical protein
LWRITWNQTAIDQFKKQAVSAAAEEAFKEAKCPECGTSPRRRRFCDCGDLEGVVTER